MTKLVTVLSTLLYEGFKLIFVKLANLLRHG